MKRRTPNKIWDWPFFIVVFYTLFEYARPQAFYSILRQMHPGWISYSIMFGLLVLTNRLFTDKNSATKYLLALLFVMTIHIGMALNSFYAFQLWRQTLLNTIAFLAIANFVNTYEKLERYIQIWVGINIFGAFVGLNNGGRIPFSAYMGDENDFALVMNIGIPIAFFLFLREKASVKKILFLVACTIFVIANVSSFSRGGFVGLIPILIFCFYKSPNKALSSVFILIILAVLALFATGDYWTEVNTITDDGVTDGTGAIRWYLWKNAWRMFCDNSFMGVGQGNFSYNLPFYEDFAGFFNRFHGGEKCHSMYMEVLAELGLVGVALFSGFLFVPWRQANKSIKLERKVLVHSDLATAKEKKIMKQLNDTKYILWGIFGGFMGFLASASFLSVTYYPHLYVFIGALSATIAIRKKLLAAVS